MKYKLRPLEVEAIQFGDNPQEVFSWAMERTTENTSPEIVMVSRLGMFWERVPEGIELVSKKKIQKLLPGDYLVLIGSRFMTMDANLFESSYTEVK